MTWLDGSLWMSGTTANIVGIIGSALFLIGFIYANFAVKMNALTFNLLNLAGAILLLASLSVHFNLAAFILEVCWGLISIVGIGKAVLDRRRNTTLDDGA